MSNWTKNYSDELTQEQIQAVENNDKSKFTSAFEGKEIEEECKEARRGGKWGKKYAEVFEQTAWLIDESAWLRARNAYLEHKMKEAEASPFQQLMAIMQKKAEEASPKKVTKTKSPKKTKASPKKGAEAEAQ